VRGKVDVRDRQYHIEYDGKDFKRDISMLIPEKRTRAIDVNHYDPTAEMSLQVKPALFKPGYLSTGKCTSINCEIN
jgi:hypothetical protein